MMHPGERRVGGMLTLTEDMVPGGCTLRRIGYIAVEDVDGAAGRLGTLGGTVHRPPGDIPEVGRVATVADPQGATFNLFKAATGGEANQPAVAGTVGWHELHTADAPATFRFYETLFGWARGENIDMRARGSYQVFSVGGGMALHASDTEGAGFALLSPGRH